MVRTVSSTPPSTISKVSSEHPLHPHKATAPRLTSGRLSCIGLRLCDLQEFNFFFYNGHLRTFNILFDYNLRTFNILAMAIPKKIHHSKNGDLQTFNMSIRSAKDYLAKRLARYWMASTLRGTCTSMVPLSMATTLPSFTAFSWQ